MRQDGLRYGHFCVLARTLEQVGDRWTLLVVRDLVNGPMRFTDLMDRLGGITPKTLTQRLRRLEAEGLVEAQHEPGRREVWYRLTESGRDLEPALEELMDWGLRHLMGPPDPGEPSHPEHLLWALRVTLEREHKRVPGAMWAFHVVDDGSYLLSYDGESWKLERSDRAGDVTIIATKGALARLLTTPPPLRRLDDRELRIDGSAHPRRAFLKAIEIFPLGRQASSGRR
jgi:DNA-binding HxlR family transcriptional regulator